MWAAEASVPGLVGKAAARAARAATAAKAAVTAAAAHVRVVPRAVVADLRELFRNRPQTRDSHRSARVS